MGPTPVWPSGGYRDEVEPTVTRFLRKMLEEKGEERNLPPCFQPGKSHLSFFRSRVLTARRAARAAATEHGHPEGDRPRADRAAVWGVSTVCGNQKLGALPGPVPGGTTLLPRIFKGKKLTQPNPGSEAVSPGREVLGPAPRGSSGHRGASQEVTVPRLPPSGVGLPSAMPLGQ